MFVRLMTNVSISFFVNKKATTRELMQEIRNRDGIAIDHQRLIYAGKQMDPDQAMYRYGVRNGAVIHLVLRLVGGSEVVAAAWNGSNA